MIQPPVHTFPFIRNNKTWSQRVIDIYADKIFDICNALLGINKKVILSKKKTADLVLLRKSICNIFWGKYGMHPETIANFINRDRTSCLYYMKHHDGDYAYYQDYKNMYDLLEVSFSAVIDLEVIEEMQEEHVQEYMDRKTSILIIDKLRAENNELKNKINKLEHLINE
jgi:hypothetical protein|tara:strand:+ start:7390 stop:7896 length:507 start_codon:yes stop_codon:yes gene_type:complete